MIFLGFILPIFALLLEIYPRLINRKYGVDIWTHLLYLKEYKEQGGIPEKITKGFVIQGIYDYPPAFIFLLAKLPFSLVEKYEYLFSAIFDLLHMVLFFFIVFFITDNVYIALLTQLFYMLTPIIVIENSTATPRSLGYTLFTITFVSLFYYMQTSNILLFFLSVLSGGFIFLSHRFTTQGFLFFSIFFSLLYIDLIYIAAFLLSLVVAIYMSKGFYLQVLRGHLGNMLFWQKNIHYRFAHQVKGNYDKYKTKDFVFRIYNECLKFPPFVLTITNPWTLGVFYTYFFIPQKDQFLNYSLMWVLYSYVLALLTLWIKPLRFLGEGQRYLELSAFPAAFVSARLLFLLTGSSQSLIILIYIIICLASFITIIVIQRKAIIKDTLRTITPELGAMFDYLRNLRKKPRLLCIPHQITTNTIYHTGCEVLVNADYTNIMKISDVFPYIKLPILAIMKKYKLDMILLNEEYASVKDLKLDKYRIVKKVGNIVLITTQ